MDNLKKLIHSSKYNNEFSQKLLSFENYFTDIYIKFVKILLKEVVDHIYLMVRTINIKLKHIKNKNYYMKNQKIKKIF